jgi:hypothetical protein
MRELVREAVRLIEAVALPAEAAEPLARLVGSREELLAHLLVCRRSFAACPEIVAAIRLAAVRVPPGPTDDRPTDECPAQAGNALRDRADYRLLDADLRALFAEAAAGTAHGKAASALLQFRTGMAGRTARRR